MSDPTTSSAGRVASLLGKCPWLSDADAGVVLGLSQQATQQARERARIPNLRERKRLLLRLLLRDHPDAPARDLCAMAAREGLEMHERTVLGHRKRMGLARTRWGRRKPSA